MERQWLPALEAFYAAYMAYFGVESDKVDEKNLDAKDRATIAGLRAALLEAPARSSAG
jgi:hypothetical protein